MSRIGIALVGLGPASQPHAASLIELSDQVDVRWAVGRNPERSRAFAAQYPFPVTTDLHAAITDPAVQAVIILTPNAHRAHMAPHRAECEAWCATPGV
jgi:predicted dehydrogenase